MTPQVLTVDQLTHVVPPLIADKSVVALVADRPGDPWAVRAAWALARAAADRRRVALVDVSLGEGALDAGARTGGGTGIANAFESGVPLSDVAQDQGEGLFYIPAGTTTSAPAAIHRHERWERLQRGFASQGAILLVYLPTPALGELALPLDGIVVLAERGAANGYAAVAPVLAMVQPTPAAARRLRVPWRHVMTGAAGTLGVVSVALAILWLLPTPDPALPHTPVPTIGASPAADPAGEPVGADPADLFHTPAADPADDTLFYAVQVAAFTDLAPAAELADRLHATGVPGTVTPVLVGPGPTRWYRVLAGALSSPATADSLRRFLWSGDQLARGQGVILRTPEAYQLAVAPSADAARETARGLRERGLPAYIVAGANGTARVLLGAFENPEQARAADSLLAAFGLQRTLVTRIGRPQ